MMSRQGVNQLLYHIAQNKNWKEELCIIQIDKDHEGYCFSGNIMGDRITALLDDKLDWDKIYEELGLKTDKKKQDRPKGKKNKITLDFEFYN